ncbi:MAG: tyrosine-type recombinase/integrase [Bacteroidetes bacterium]|nr:tyrosine-type recombinase/integrase [Bacteroidota bacterium]
MSSLSNRLRQARKLRGLKQADLAHLVDSGPVVISQWETEAKKPSPRSVGALAQALGVRREWPEQVQAFLREVDRGAFAWSGQVVEREREPHVRLAIRLQIGLGLRETEALGFRWEWLDRRNRVYTPGATKNRKTRIIPVPEWLFLELEQLWETAKRPATGFAMLGEDHRPHRKGFTLRPVKASGAQLRIVNLHPHRLRATFATSHWEAGTALAQIQQMLGHKDPETTMRYIVMRPKETAAAQDKVAAMMGFRSPSGPRAPKREAAS